MTGIASAIDVSHKTRGTLMVALSGMLYGLMGYFGMQLIFQHFSVPNLLFWRFLMATLWMFVIGMTSKKRRAKLANGRLLLKLGSIGAISYTGGSAFFYASATHIGTGPAVVLMYAFPIFVVILAMMFENWRMNRYAFLSLFMVFSGLLLLNGKGDHALDKFGVLYGILSAFCYAIYVYYSQSSSKKVDSHWLTLLVCMGCTIAFLNLAFITDTFMVPSTMQAWGDLLVLSIVATAIPIQLLLNGLKHISHIKASILSMLEPAVTVVIGVIFLNEHLVTSQVLGVVIILFGAIAIQFEDKHDCQTAMK